MKCYVGIDPGKTGAIAVIGEDAVFVSVHDWPGDSVAAWDILNSLRLEHDIRFAAIEHQQAFPGQGVTSMFHLGENYGAWLGLLAASGIPTLAVRPQEWKKGLIPPKSDKQKSLEVARRMYPNAPLTRKKDHGRADALLIAWWAEGQRVRP